MNSASEETLKTASGIIRDTAKVIGAGRVLLQNLESSRSEALREELALINFTIHDVDSALYAENKNRGTLKGANDLFAMHKLLGLLKAVYQTGRGDFEAIEMQLIQAAICVLLDHTSLSAVVGKVRNAPTSTLRAQFTADLHLICWCIQACDFKFGVSDSGDSSLIGRLVKFEEAAASLEQAFKTSNSVAIEECVAALVTSVRKLRPGRNYSNMEQLLQDHCPKYNQVDFLTTESTLATIMKLMYQRYERRWSQAAVNTAAPTSVMRDRKLADKSPELSFALNKLEHVYTEEETKRKLRSSEINSIEDLVIGLATVRLTQTSYAFFESRVKNGMPSPVTAGISASSTELLAATTLHHDLSVLVEALRMTTRMRLGQAATLWQSSTRVASSEFIHSCMASLQSEHEVNAQSLDSYSLLETAVHSDVAKMVKYYKIQFP